MLAVLVSCKQQEKPAISFYYWKTVFSLSLKEKEVLATNGVTRIYLRYFDIDLLPDQQPYPVSPVIFKETVNKLEIVPVIYIKNKVMLHPWDLAQLAKKTAGFVRQINQANKINCNEIQIDCDWTMASRDNYLQFIDLFKKESGKRLSATIRLHQVKYFGKTRIPNVDKGVLMYYNMGKIAPDSLNSIYDRNIAQKYLKHLKNYPLPLAVALPVYSWAIHIRDGKVIGLKNKTHGDSFKNDPDFKRIKAGFFQIVHSKYRKGTFYRKNDILKIEQVAPPDLYEMAEDIAQYIKEPPKEVIFYDLDEFNTQRYEKTIFKEVADRF